MSEHTSRTGTRRGRARRGVRRWRRTAGCLCLLACLVYLGNARGQDERTNYVPPQDLARDYFVAIDRIEAEYGPYASELSDLYLGLGQALMDRGDYRQALDAFSRGVMVVRVNSGPNSPQQTDHLYVIANIEALLGNIDAADKVLRNIYFVNAEYYGEDSLEMLPVIERMYHWYLVTRPFDSERSEFGDYERAIRMREQILEISEKHHGPGGPETAMAYRRLGEVHFQTIRYLLEQGVAFTLDTRLEFLNRTIEMADGSKAAIGDHYQAGRSAFGKYLDAIESDGSRTTGDLAQVYADLGDWYLGIGKFRNARELYERSYQALSQSEHYPDLAENFLARPRPVHFFQPPPGFLEDNEAGLPELNLDISMTVTRHGNVQHAEVLNAPDDLPESVLGDILRMVRQMRFRPAVRGGEVVATEDFIWQFAILPQKNAS